MILVLLLAFGQDKPLIIERLNPQKEAYDRAVRACEQALRLLETDPEGALQKLNEVHEKLDPPDKPGLKDHERVLRFEVQSGDYSAPVAFYPYQSRGRVRLKLAAVAKGIEERRRLLTEAVADLQKSVEKGVESSGPLLAGAKAELAKLPPPPPPAPTPAEVAAAWSKEWAALRPRIAAGTFKPGEAALVETAGKLLKRLAPEASTRDQVEVAAWIAAEVEGAKGRVKALSREEAKRAVAWCETLSAAIAAIDALKAARESLGKVRDDAARIAQYRGSFTLKIGPSPYAEDVRILREGKEILLVQRATPLVAVDLEIGDFTVELAHPDSGKRTVTIPASLLREGKAYVLSGRMKGELAVTLLP
ncbi:MAG TPA: hypothetical protein VJB14_16285 [Planctomycetota bacterium]|nr:hypothetical protein [Planctomycetota bacterium]